MKILENTLQLQRWAVVEWIFITRWKFGIVGKTLDMNDDKKGVYLSRFYTVMISTSSTRDSA